VLDIADRMAYEALVDRMSVDLIGDLSPNTFGWRLPPVAPTPGVYSHNNKQWDNYRGQLNLLGNTYSVALKTDVVSFFAGVPIEFAQEAIQDRTSKGMVTDRLCDMLGGFDATPNRSGLPQRSSASAVVANMYLRPLDDVLVHHAKPMPVHFGSKIRYHSCARWMDDLWLFGSDEAAARRAQVELQAEAQSLGLHLNAAKTEVLTGADVAEQALEIEHSAVDDALLSLVGNSDFGPLEELIDRLLDEPEKASRTSIRFITKRMRDHNHRYRVQDMVQLAHRMPHVADAWARLFKEAFTNESLQDWYLDYARGEWSTFEWSVAQFGRMFPSRKRPRKALREFFAEAVRDANTSLPLLAVSAQRLSAWDASEGRTACRDAYRRAATAHARRILALTASGLGETRTTIKNWLKNDKENYPTLRMLETYGFVPPKVQADFAD
jgi:Reverse transcriptase (RNA-dependent DNA polymerase)